MASLQTLTFAQIVQLIATQAQANSSQPLAYDLGSVELALAEADASVVQWLQSLIVTVMNLTRASTSQGADLDTWMADFDIVTREAASSALGQVTFSRFTTTNKATIAPGVTVQTADGTQTFTVIADTTQSAWDASLNAYIIPAGTASAQVSVQANVAGAAGNVQANTVTVIGSAIPYVDTVTNALAFSGGANAESDASLLARFQLALQGLEKGIKASVAAAIESLQQNLQFSIVENQTLGGQTQLGYFYVVISPYTSTLQQQVYAAVDAVRPLSVSFGVFAATNLAANVAVTVTAATGYAHSQVAAAVQSALSAFIASIPLGSGLLWSELYSVVWGVPGVATANGLTLNGGTSDIAASPQQAIAVGTITVS